MKTVKYESLFKVGVCPGLTSVDLWYRHRDACDRLKKGPEVELSDCEADEWKRCAEGFVVMAYRAYFQKLEEEAARCAA